jgi:hypothetical protein
LSRLPYIVETFGDARAIAVAEIGPRYCVVDSGNDYYEVEARMAKRTSQRGDLANLDYETFRMSELMSVDFGKLKLGRSF